MMYRILIAATALALALVVAGCSPSSRFAELAASFEAATASDATESAAAEPAERLTAQAAAAREIEDNTLPVLAYLPQKPQASNSAPPDIDRLIVKYADHYNIPASLVRSVVKRESTFNPAAKNGKHWGLMQLNYQTAKTMGYRGAPSGLFDAETNLKYGVKYLAGAYLVADGDAVRADRLYQTGYYYHAKRKGLLKETGLRP